VLLFNFFCAAASAKPALQLTQFIGQAPHITRGTLHPVLYRTFLIQEKAKSPKLLLV
jgi:hypothetical protein